MSSLFFEVSCGGGVWIPEPVDRFWVPSKQLSGLALGVSVRDAEKGTKTYTAVKCWWKTSNYMDMFAAIWHSETRRKGLLLLYISVYSKCCKTVQLTWEMKVGVGYARIKVPMRGWNCSYDIWTTNRIKEVVSAPKTLSVPEGMTISPTIKPGFAMYLYAMQYVHLKSVDDSYMYTVYTCFSWKELQRMIRLVWR